MPSRRAVRSIGTASELDRCSRCTDAPVCRAASIRCAIAMFSDAARPRREEVGVVPPVRRRGALDRGRVLRVDDHLRPVGGQHAQVLLELLGRQRRELLHAGVGHEALEPEDAGVVQPAQVADVARDRAAPEADVDVRGVPRGLPLDLQPVDGGGRRDAVERHVEDRRDAARRRGAGGGREALPLGAAGLVDVHVAVDEAGQQHLVVGQVDGLGAPRAATRAARSRPRPRRGRRCSGAPHRRG